MTLHYRFAGCVAAAALVSMTAAAPGTAATYNLFVQAGTTGQTNSQRGEEAGTGVSVAGPGSEARADPSVALHAAATGLGALPYQPALATATFFSGYQVAGSGGAPVSLSLNFELDGELAAEAGVGAVANASFGYGIETLGQQVNGGASVGCANGRCVTTRSNIGEAAFVGPSVDADVSLRAETVSEGVLLATLAASAASSPGAAARSDFLSTFRLASITAEDSILASFPALSVLFDSGFEMPVTAVGGGPTPAPVPGPLPLALLLGGLASLIAVRRSSVRTTALAV